MKVSIVVPVYNVAAYLVRCLDSIRSQTYSNFEVLLVNDGSSDLSGEICDNYKGLDKRFRVIHKKNGGVSSARNAGIESAVGTVLCFIDSDDYVDANYLKCLVDDWHQSPDTEMVFQGVSRIFTDGQIKNTNIPNININARDTYSLFNIAKVSLNGNPVGKLYKTTTIQREKLYFVEAFTYNEDMIFVLEYILLCSGTIVFSNTIHYNYMINSGSLTNRLLAPQEYLKPYIYYKDLFYRGYMIDKDDENFTIIYENFKINLHMYMNSAILSMANPMSEFGEEDLSNYITVSRHSNLRRRFMDFFILNGFYFIPRSLAKVFFKK